MPTPSDVALPRRGEVKNATLYKSLRSGKSRIRREFTTIHRVAMYEAPDGSRRQKGKVSSCPAPGIRGILPEVS
jgi:hypothetical protein